MPPKVSIIFGEPKKRDALGGKGHERSARALADGIRQIAEKPLKDKDDRPYQDLGGAIGLEGAWGSGKSTVIDIAKADHLKDDFWVFTFDLWRHQSDDFRRSLLEEFLLYVKGLIKDGQLGANVINVKKKQDEVRNRTTVTTKTDQRRFTWVGILFILSIPFLPLIYTWLSPVGPFYKLMETWDRWDKIWWIAKATTGLVGAFVVVAFFAAFRVKEKEKYSFPKWFTAGASHLFNITRQEEVNDEIKTIRDEDPTTVEFRKVFEEILGPVQKAGRRVVFVLDNIDRLPVEDVRRVWADLRALNSKGKADKNASVIAVIPYDRAHVSEAFPPIKSKRPASPPPQTVLLISPLEASDTKVQHEVLIRHEKPSPDAPVESDVFEKTFDRIVKVSAPLASDWKGYLIECVSEAFGKNHGHDTDKLFRLLKYRLELEGVQPTPRRIISFVNEIGGLWVQWYASEISLATIALYVLHRGEFDRNPEQLSQIDPVNVRFQRIVDDPEYARNLAALAFNVDPDKANQVRLGQPIAKALIDDRGPEALQELAKADGFNELFQDELRNRLLDWSSDSPESISQAALNVADMASPPHGEAAIWGIFGDIVGQVRGLSYDIVDDVPGIFKIVEKQRNPRIMAAIVRSKFESTKPEEESKLDPIKDGHRWISLMHQLCNALETSEGGVAASEFWTTTLPSNDHNFTIGAAKTWHEAPFYEFDQLDLGEDMKGLSDALLQRAALRPELYQPAMNVLHQKLEEFAPAHLEQIASLVQSGELGDRLIHLLKVPSLFLPDHADDVVKSLDGVAAGGDIAAIAWPAEIKGFPENSAPGLFLTVIASKAAELSEGRGTDNPEATSWYNVILNDASGLSQKTIELLAEEVAVTGSASRWISLALDRASAGGLVQVVLVKLLERPEFHLSDLPFIAKRFNDLKSMLGQDGAENLVRRFSGSAAIAAHFSGSLVTKVPDAMFEILGNLPRTAEARDIIRHTSDYLDGLTQEVWEKALLTSTSQEIRLLRAMHKIGARHIESQDFLQALASNAILVLEGKFSPSSVSGGWDAVIASIRPDNHAQLRTLIETRFYTAATTPLGAEQFVAHYGPLAVKLKFSGTEETADRALMSLYLPLLQSGTPIAEEFLKECSPEIKRCLKKASTDARNGYESAVKQAEAKKFADDDGQVQQD